MGRPLDFDEEFAFEEHFIRWLDFVHHRSLPEQVRRTDRSASLNVLNARVSPEAMRAIKNAHKLLDGVVGAGSSMQDNPVAAAAIILQNLRYSAAPDGLRSNLNEVIELAMHRRINREGLEDIKVYDVCVEDMADEIAEMLLEQGWVLPVTDDRQ